MEFSRVLYQALLDAFDKPGFEQLLRFGLERDLSEISTASRMTAIVFDVIDAATREGWLADLAEKAIAENPNNPKLKALSALDIDSSVGDMDQGVVREIELVIFGSERGHIDGVLIQMKRMTEMMDGMLSRIESIEEQRPRHMRLMWSMALTSAASAVFAGLMALGGI